MKTKKPKVVIVGGGFGGVKAALDLTREDYFDITIITENDSFRYYPSLYRTATGGSRAVSDIGLEDIFEERKIRIVQKRATLLDRAQKHIRTADGEEYGYDYLVLALGVVTNYFNIPGLEELSFGIKSVEDAEELKKHLHRQITDERKPDLNYVVVGGGPTGIELAGVLGDYIRYICDKHGVKRPAVHVDLVEAGRRLVPRMPRDISRRIARQLRTQGVKLYLNAKVEGQTASELLVNGKPIRSHTVIWTAGTSNNPFFTENGFQLSSNRKVRVDQYLQAEPSIFVIGDNADTPYSGMAQTALFDGAYVAKSLLILERDQQAPAPYKAKKPIYVLPAGPRWAAVLWGPFRVYGRKGWLLRRAADLLGYRDYEDVFAATKLWFAEYEKDDICPICQPEEYLLPKAS